MEIGAAANAKNAPDRTAVVFEDARYTWRMRFGRSGKILKREIRARYQ